MGLHGFNERFDENFSTFGLSLPLTFLFQLPQPDTVCGQTIQPKPAVIKHRYRGFKFIFVISSNEHVE